MPNQHGEFIWYELATDNADAAQHFYMSDSICRSTATWALCLEV